MRHQQPATIFSTISTSFLNPAQNILDSWLLGICSQLLKPWNLESWLSICSCAGKLLRQQRRQRKSRKRLIRNGKMQSPKLQPKLRDPKVLAVGEGGKRVMETILMMMLQKRAKRKNPEPDTRESSMIPIRP